MSQKFVTTDVLRLEIEDDPTGLVNLVQNPSGELGGWGWVTPVATSKMSGDGTRLTYNSPNPAAASYFYTEAMPMTAGWYAAASWNMVAVSGYYRVKFEWLNSSGVLIGSSTQTGYLTTTGTVYLGPYLAPALTAYVRLRFDHYSSTGGANPTAGSPIQFKEATVAKAATAGALATVRTNLIKNPSFEVDAANWGTYGSSTPTLTRSSAVTAAVGSWCGALSMASSGSVMGLIATSVPVTGGETYTVQFRARPGSTARYAEVGFGWNGAAASRVAVGSEVGGAWTTFSKTVTAPPGATTVNIYLGVTAAGGTIAAGEVHYFDATLFEKASSVGTYFDGSTVLAGHTFAWTGTAHASTSTDTVSTLSYIAPVPYLNILGSSHDIKVNREALNIGTLTATILDASIDPAQDDLIRPGRRVRLTALDGSTWVPLFNGKATEASVTYELKDPTVPVEKRARIVLTAVDANADLANQRRSEGVTTVASLPYVLEGCGVPWNCNGSGNQVASATVVSRNDNASALDQIAVTRDTNLGYAWVDRNGVAQVWDSATFSPNTAPAFGDDVIGDLDVSYNTGDCINEVNIKFLRLNPTTGETEEIAYGPYRNETSIAEWGVRSADFTIQGLSEETSDIPDLAAVILAANADPQVTINSLTAAVTTTTLLDTNTLLLDLMDKPFLYPSISGSFFYESVLVSSIEHVITPDKWLVKFGFLHPDVVASPTFIPSPETGAGGLTIGQLLRPVGEVTMFYGSLAQIPAGWLPCNGSTFSSTTYPDLFALLGSTTLPNFTDRFPIGAGTKAVGSSGGNASQTIAANNLPAHTHSVGTLAAANESAHTHAAGTLATGNESAHTHGAGALIATRKAGVGTSTGVAQGNTSAGTGDLNIGGSTGAGSAHNHSVSGSTAAGAAHTHTLSGSTGNNTSLGTSLDVLNPWRAIYFIIRAV